MRILSTSILVLIIVASIGCATPGSRSVQPMKSNQQGAIVGNMTAPGGINALILFNYGKVYGFSRPSTARMDEKGNFIFENLEPGKYYLSHYVSGSGGSQRYQIASGKKSVKRNLVEVKAGKIKYIGSFSVRNVKRKFIGTGSFTFSRIKTPTERTILQALMPKLKGTGWDKIALSRIKSL